MVKDQFLAFHGRYILIAFRALVSLGNDYEEHRKRTHEVSLQELNSSSYLAVLKHILNIVNLFSCNLKEDPVRKARARAIQVP